MLSLRHHRNKSRPSFLIGDCTQYFLQVKLSYMIRNISLFPKHINSDEFYMSHDSHAIRQWFNIHPYLVYGKFLDDFHLYQDIINSVHYSQHVIKEVSF